MLRLPAILLFAALFAAPAHAQFFGGVHSVAVPLDEGALPRPTLADRAAAHAVTPDGIAHTTYVPLAWPLARTYTDHLWVVNYVDHDPSGAVLDFQGGAWTYDGHSGTDIALNDFRLMDQGTAVRAAAPGVVTYMSDTSVVDRSCTFDWPDGGNWIWIAASDGTFHEYYHLRRASIAVKLGETVQTGQFLGYVGSSGYTTIPHLHFEAGAYDGPGGAYQPRDPYHGSNNALPTLWAAPQDAYAGGLPLHLLDLGIYTESQVSGNLFNFSYCNMLSPMPVPATFGTSENYIGMWFHYQSPGNDTLTVTLKRPDGSVYGTFPYVSTNPEPVGWFWAYYYFGGQGPSAYGTWRLQASRRGVLLGERAFTVAATTTFAPRIWPRAGRSFRLSASTQRDTLRRYFLSPTVTYSLSGAPANVTLTDSVLTIGPSVQSTRSRTFLVIATDAQARRDTAWYHLVDLNKPADPVSAAPPPAAPSQLRLAAAPQPFHDTVTLTFALPRAGAVQLSVHDLAGRRVRTLAQGEHSAGEHAARWDGRDDAGRALSAGVYFARLVTPSGTARTLLVRF